MRTAAIAGLLIAVLLVGEETGYTYEGRDGGRTSERSLEEYLSVQVFVGWRGVVRGAPSQ